jgi:hypothetical protein
VIKERQWLRNCINKDKKKSALALKLKGTKIAKFAGFTELSLVKIRGFLEVFGIPSFRISICYLQSFLTCNE